MSNGRNNNNRGQGGQQKPQIPEIIMTAKVSGRTVILDVQVKTGNRALPNQQLSVYVDGVLSGIAATTDANGVAKIPVSVDPGQHMIGVQFTGGTVKSAVAVDIPRDPSPKRMVHPVRIKNKLGFRVVGRPGDKVVFADNETSETKEVDSKGNAEFSVNLENGDEHEIFVSVPGAAKVYRKTFFRYDSRQIQNGYHWLILAIPIFLFWVALLSFKSVTEGMPISAVLGLKVLSFLVYAFVATQTRANNFMAVGLLLVAVASIFCAFGRETGQNPFSWLVENALKNSEFLRQAAISSPRPYSGSGSWIWWLMVPFFAIETVIFLPFAWWDEAVSKIRKLAENWSQRSFCLDEEEPKPATVVEEGQASGSFLARVWDKFDEAIVAGIGWDVIYKFITKATR